MKRLLLLGGGHSHVEVIRQLGLRPPDGVQTMLVSPGRYTPYSGMLPGFIAGHYGFHDCHIDLENLCISNGVELHPTAARAIDPAANRVHCENGSAFDYDILSIDTGSAPEAQSVPGALDHAIGIKPVPDFVISWKKICDTAKTFSRSPRIGIVGGGAGSVEVALAMHYRLHAEKTTPEFFLVTDASSILPNYPARTRHVFEHIFSSRGIMIHTRSKIVKVESGMLYGKAGDSLQADHIVWATNAGAPSWLAESGLKTDSLGFVAVNDALQSVSHPHVFAAGDIASMVNHTRPKSGVYAVRQGPPLAENLLRTLSDRPLVDYTPQKIALALISTGDKYAIAVYGSLVFKGKWVWRWKDRIDRKFMAKYNQPLR